MTVRLIRNGWWVDIRHGPTRFRKKSPENTRAGALAYEAQLRHRLSHGESLEQKPDERETTFEEFAWEWFESYVVPNNRHYEQRMKKYTLQSSLIPFFGKMPLRQITSQHIEQFKAQGIKNGASRKTVNNRLAIFRKCIKTAYDWLKLPGIVPTVIWLKCPPCRTDYLSAEECDLLLSGSTGVIHEMLLMALRTGMRQAELRGLQWDSINWDNRSLVVRHSLNDLTKRLEPPKSNRERCIPLANDLYETLHRRRKSIGHVFLDSNHKPFDCKRLICRLRQVQRRTGLRSFGWHTLRHTFASHLAIKGVPLHVVQALLGHSSIVTTMRYAHVGPSTLRSAIDMFDPKGAFDGNVGQPVGNAWSEVQHAAIRNDRAAA